MTAFILPDEFDLRNPAEFLLALHWAREWPRPQVLDKAQWERDIAVVERYHPYMFDRAGRALSAAATFEFLAELGGIEHRHGRILHSIPREWLPVFTIAFERGLINRIVLGTALRTLLTKGKGNGAPHLNAASIEARAEMLNAVKLASAMGLMERNERQFLANMPDTVSIYRGGMLRGVFDHEAVMAVAHQSMHWGTDRQLSIAYAQGRGAGNAVKAIRSSIVDLGFWAAGVPGVAATSLRGGVAGGYFLIRADIPKSLILSYCEIVSKYEGDELLVDFTRITPDMITDLSDTLNRNVEAA